MGPYVAEQVIKCMNQKGCPVNNSKILILGFTFKENCPDIRNTKVIDIYDTLCRYTPNITIVDPHAESEKAKGEYNVDILSEIPQKEDAYYDAIILAVAHDEFKSINVRSLLKNTEVGVIYDVKGFYPKDWVDARL
jgi:UDP-N-acetyl-D-galactosamine dehydrogenase